MEPKSPKAKSKATPKAVGKLKGTGHLPATAKQINCIHGFKKSMKLHDDDYREMIGRHNRRGKTHSNELTRTEASALISELQHKSGAAPAKTVYRFTKPAAAVAKPGKTAKPLKSGEAKSALAALLEKHGMTAGKPVPVVSGGNVVALASPQQRALIGHLCQEVDWYEHGSYEAWLGKNMGLEQVATKEDAAKVIEGLKGLKRNGHAKKTTG